MTDAEMHELYDRDWSVFSQKERDIATVELGKKFESIETIADLSAGGSHVTPEIAAHHGVQPILGDFGNVYGYSYVGLLEDTLPTLEPPVVDLYVCAETLEHLEEPDRDLATIREHCRHLLLTTPIIEEPWQPSHGHLWTWRRYDIEDMLGIAGFEIIEYLEVIGFFGMWRCR